MLIYAVDVTNDLGSAIRHIFSTAKAANAAAPVGVGSVFLMPEVLIKPMRSEQAEELERLAELLARIDLRPFDVTTARLATVLGSRYSLRAADAVHLATAVNAGADRFITNNRKDFRKSIAEIEVTYPIDLA